MFVVGLQGDGTDRQWVMGDRAEEEQDTDVCLWLESEEGEAEEWPNNQLWKKISL